MRINYQKFIYTQPARSVLPLYSETVIFHYLPIILMALSTGNYLLGKVKEAIPRTILTYLQYDDY